MCLLMSGAELCPAWEPPLPLMSMVLLLLHTVAVAMAPLPATERLAWAMVSAWGPHRSLHVGFGALAGLGYDCSHSHTDPDPSR
jgi:hypothetical protein